MGNIKFSFQFDPKVINELLDIPGKTAKVAVSIVEREFKDLLYNAPQRSGNYVANFAVAAGPALGRKSVGAYFPPKPTKQQMVARRSISAIEVASANNRNLKENLTKHITRGAYLWLPSMTIYNRMTYAEKVEGYSEDQLREANKGGAHAVAVFLANLDVALNRNIKYGSPEFNALVEARYL